MLKSLYVKNLALIDEAEVEFGEGLNILTGETGAGKSILLGSVNMALGAKADKDMIRAGAEYALIELTFSLDDDKKLDALKKMDILIEDDAQIVVTRRISPGRTVSRINGESVSSTTLKDVTSLLMDIHGQHEHQSLLYKSKHLEILDEYAKASLEEEKNTLRKLYLAYCETKERLAGFDMNEEQRLRECAFYQYEINEIEEANLREGEEEELEAKYRKGVNAKKIIGIMSAVYDVLTGSMGESVSDKIGTSLREVSSILQYDEELKSICSQLEDIDALCNDLGREIASYVDAAGDIDEEEFYNIEKRLDLIHKLQGKYGRTIADIEAYLEKQKDKLSELENYQENKQRLESELKELYEEALQYAESISVKRKEAARKLSLEIVNELKELNFLDVNFMIEIRKLEELTSNGLDEVEFMIAVNPGETPKPLGKIASGGELSRVMLAVKNVLSDKDQVDTLIFDEIDTGISGRTAQAVSLKLKSISRNRQVICITHLAQIAAPADNHFLIEKSVKEGRTVTDIYKLSDEQMIDELARILSGAEVTDKVLENAREMKKMAMA
ncbi:MAG: DNA repair protein RecN [Lachnospiraceae bacterium]|nr:DNA repair protein RecN [Lachnospiraceae bacterium]